METKTKTKWTDIYVFCLLAIITAYLVFLIEELVRSLITKTLSPFSQNLVASFVTILACMLAYYLLMMLENKGKIVLGNWLKVFIYTYFLLSLIVYNSFNLFTIKWIIIAVCNLTGILLSIVGVSVYYNYLKNQNSQVRAKAIMVVLFAICFTIATGLILELGHYLVTLITKQTPLTFVGAIINLAYMLVGAVAINICFLISLYKGKKFINNCLIYVEN